MISVVLPSQSLVRLKIAVGLTEVLMDLKGTALIQEFVMVLLLTGGVCWTDTTNALHSRSLDSEKGSHWVV